MNCFFYDNTIEWETLEGGKITRKIKAHNDQIMMVELIFAEGAVGALHSHPHTQATYCMGGSFEFTIDGEAKTITAGDSICFPANVQHGCRVLSTQGKLLDVFTPCREDFLKK